MLHQQQVQRLVDLQHRSYLLLKWMAKAVAEGLIRFQTAHNDTTLAEAAEAWILGHYLNIPTAARPAREDLPAFCLLFSTYLTSSFDLIAAPGKRLYSPEAHCFCPMCSWLADAPNLRAKRVTPRDKRRAQTMRVNALRRLAAQHSVNVRDEELESALHDRQAFEDVSLVAYCYELMQREQGIANGPAVLALWRGFAWNEAGSPRHGFRLEAPAIMDAESRLLVLLTNLSRTGNDR